MSREIIWVILCAGRSAQSARTIEAKVLAAIDAGQPVVEVFGYRAISVASRVHSWEMCIGVASGGWAPLAVAADDRVLLHRFCRHVAKLLDSDRQRLP